MKPKKSIFYCVVLLLAGCLPSLHPLYNDKTLIFKEELIGKWMGDDSIWQFSRAGEKEYELRIREDEEELGRLSAHLVKIKGLMFLDLFPDDKPLEDLDDFYKIHILPVHTFIKVDQINPNLRLRMIDYDKVKKMIESDPNVIKHEVVDDDRIVLTASTDELQNFVVEHVDTLFYDSNDSSDLIRLEPLYSEENIVIDPNFVGQWKDEDGGILHSKRMGETAYELIYTGTDGTKHEIFANFVRHHKELLMAAFFDKAELDPDQPHSYLFHLIPDWFFRVDKMESELTLQKIDREKVAQILQNDTSSKQYQPVDADFVFRGTRIEPK